MFIRHFDFKELLSNRQVVCLIPLRPPKSICSQRRGRLPPTRCPLDQTNQGWRGEHYDDGGNHEYDEDHVEDLDIGCGIALM